MNSPDKYIPTVTTYYMQIHPSECTFFYFPALHHVPQA